MKLGKPSVNVIDKRQTLQSVEQTKVDREGNVYNPVRDIERAYNNRVTNQPASTSEDKGNRRVDTNALGNLIKEVQKNRKK